MDKVIHVPLNTNNWLVFSLYEIDGTQHTGAVNGEFTVDMIRDGAAVGSPGLTVYEIGAGRYHITNQLSNLAYQSSSEEQVYIRVSHSTHDGVKLFHFWARNVDSDVDYPTTAEIADGVWDEAIADHQSAGSFGAKNQKVVPSETLSDYKADVSALATSAEVAGVDGKIDIIDTNVDAIPGLISAAESNIRGTDGDDLKDLSDQIEAIPVSEAPSAAAIADAVWDEAATDHVSSGTFGEVTRRIVGLLFENYKLSDIETDDQGNMTSCSIELYSEPALTNLIASYTMTATYSSGVMTAYQVVRD